MVKVTSAACCCGPKDDNGGGPCGYCGVPDQSGYNIASCCGLREMQIPLHDTNGNPTGQSATVSVISVNLSVGVVTAGRWSQTAQSYQYFSTDNRCEYEYEGEDGWNVRVKEGVQANEFISVNVSNAITSCTVNGGPVGPGSCVAAGKINAWNDSLDIDPSVMYLPQGWQKAAMDMNLATGNGWDQRILSQAEIKNCPPNTTPCGSGWSPGPPTGSCDNPIEYEGVTYCPTGQCPYEESFDLYNCNACRCGCICENATIEPEACGCVMDQCIEDIPGVNWGTGCRPCGGCRPWDPCKTESIGPLTGTWSVSLQGGSGAGYYGGCGGSARIVFSAATNAGTISAVFKAPENTDPYVFACPRQVPTIVEGTFGQGTYYRDIDTGEEILNKNGWVYGFRHIDQLSCIPGLETAVAYCEACQCDTCAVQDLLLQHVPGDEAVPCNAIAPAAGYGIGGWS